MNQRLKLAVVCSSLILFGALAFASRSHCQSDVASLPFSPAPYKVGEHLTFNVSFSNFNSVAHVELFVAARGAFFGRESIQLKSHAETTGVVNAALFAINNDYIAYVDPATGLPSRVQQVLREASRTSDTSTDFNEPAGLAAIGPNRTGEFQGIYDLISAVYRVRALPLSEGATYYLSVRIGNQTYQVEVRVVGKQIIKTNVGSFNTVVSQIRVKNDSDANSYRIRIFFSDDQRHVPVLATAKHPAGEIRAELAGSEFISGPAAVPSPRAQQSPTALTNSPPLVIAAQPTSDNGTLEGLPFKVGEQLNYRVFLPTIPAPVALSTFQVKARSKYFDRDGLLFTLTAQTTNALQHLFFANDKVSSYADPKTLLPFRTELHLVEGRRVVNRVLTVNQDYGTVTTDQGSKIEIPVGTHDVLSVFYALRTFNLTPPRRSAMSILVNEKPKTLFISALKREAITLGSQTIPAIQVSLTTDDPQTDKYQLRAWISDDSRRLPLRVTASTPLGVMRADLAIIPLTTQ